MDKIGVASNTDKKTEVAVSFAIGKVHTDQYYLENQSEFKDVKIVKKLPKRKQIRGQITSVDEVIYLIKKYRFLLLKIIMMELLS